MKRVKKKKKIWPKIIIALILVAFFAFIGFHTRFWSRQEKLTLVINRGKEGVVVAIFNPKLAEITTIFLPANVQVLVAGELGSWRLGSVWQLGFNEKIGGSLLARTITKNFAFPTVAWADRPAFGFVNGRMADFFKAVFGAYKTNLTIGDRIRIALFCLRTTKTGREEIHLNETNLLKKTRFIDGEEGYLVAGQIPEAIAAIFSSNQASGQSLKARIIDSSQKALLAEKLGRVIEVAGIKVIAISQENGKDLGCRIWGKNRILIERFAQIFGCKKEKNSSANFDLEIEIGKNFSQQF